MKLTKTLTTAASVLLGTLTACGHAGGSSATKDNSNNIKKEKTMQTVHLTTQEFKEKVWNYETSSNEFKYEGKLPAIVDFYATWCGPCKQLSPVLEDFAKEYEGKIVIYKVDVDKAEEVAAVFGIRSIPTLLLIPGDGSKPSLQAGAPTRTQLKGIIDEMVQ